MPTGQLTDHPTSTTPDLSALGPVIVTGGASGLGQAVARAVALAGATPIVLDREAPDAALEHELVDLSDPRAAEAVVDDVAQRHGGLGAVVTAAGTDACGELHEVAPDDWDRVVLVNLLGTAAVVRAGLRHMRPGHGRVVTIASTLGLRALPAATAYCASKFGVVGFTRALSAEVTGRHAVTLVVTGGMRTHFFDGRDPQYQPPPDMALQDPGDVADAICFALSRPPGSELRELVVCPPGEPSWP